MQHLQTRGPSDQRPDPIRTPRKVLLAVDPLEPERDGRAASEGPLRFLSWWSSHEPLEIHAFYLLSATDLALGPAPSSPETLLLLESAKDAAEKTLFEWIRKSGLDKIIGFRSAEVLIDPSPSLREAIQTSLGRAPFEGSSIAVLGKPHDIGSFAETWLQVARLPTLLVPQRPGASGYDAKKILYATDLSRESRRALDKLTDFLKAWGSQVALFHALPEPVLPVLQAGAYLLGGGWLGGNWPEGSPPAPKRWLSKRLEHGEELLSDWKASLRTRGLTVQTKVTPVEGPLWQVITEEALREDASLLCLAPRHSGARAALVGGLVKRIIRASSVPVLVLPTRSQPEEH